MKHIATKVLAGVLLFYVSGLVYAADVSPEPGVYAFSGPVISSASSANFGCSLSLNVKFTEENDGGVTVLVDQATTTMGFFGLCSAVDFDLPWIASIEPEEIPVDSGTSFSFIFSNVDVLLGGRNCSLDPVSLPVVFSNGSPSIEASTISFDADVGSCSVMARLTAPSDVNILK